MEKWTGLFRFGERRRNRRERKRGVWHAKKQLSAEEIQQQRQEFGLSGTATYASLENLSGRGLLESKPVVNVLSYSADWEQFTVNKEPQVTTTSPLDIDPLTSEIHLPYPFITPSKKDGENNHWGNTQFYWDCYLINKALLGSGRKDYIQLAINHVENFQYLFDRLGYIPNGSKLSIANRSQTPFLTGMIMDIYEVTGDKKWLAEKMELAKREYRDVWMYTEKQGKERGISRPSHRISEESLLLRPCGTDILNEHYEAAAMETADDSAEWARRAHETAPLLLNGALYKYEIEFAKAADILGNSEEAQSWQAIADERKREINEKMWDKEKGMYFNLQLNRETGEWERDNTYFGLPAFVPLWLNIATSEQAERVVQHLPKFESQYGLFIAAADSIVDPTTMRRINRTAYKDYSRYIPALDDVFREDQWNYPNIWSPIEYFAIEGLINYEKPIEAKRVIENMLRANAAYFQERGTLPEKLSGITGYNGGSFQYGDQEGFGWTCAVTQIGAGRLEYLEQNKIPYATMAS